MRRLTTCTLLSTIVFFALNAPAAFAQASGEGLYGETDDKVVTYAGFILIVFFPVLVFVLTVIQQKLDKKRDARLEAARARRARADLRGGW